MVDWTQFDAVQLVTYTLFVFWQPMPMTSAERKFYRDQSGNLPVYARLPTYVFPMVWFVLHVCLVAGMTLFAKWTVDGDHWVWRTVWSLFYINVLASKLWTFLFFTMKWGWMSLANAIFLMATALAMTICVVIGRDNVLPDPYWAVPFSLFLVYTIWLTYAVLLTATWLFKLPEMRETPKQMLDTVKTMEQQIRMSRQIHHQTVKEK